MIFLNILKIIGFVLLGIIGLILFIILLVLIWPFKYKIEADYHEKFKAKAVLSFLFHFVRVIFTFEDGNPLLIAKVLWIKVYENNFSEEPEEEPSVTDEIPDDFFDSSGEAAEGSTESPNEGVEAGESDGSDYTKEKENEEEITEEDFGPGKEEIDEFMAKELPPESPKSVVDEFFDHIENIISKLREKWYNLKRSVKEFRKKARYYSGMIRYYYKVLHYKSMEPAFKMVKKTLIGIIKHIRPRKVRITLHYGADDPADTANAIAIYSMIYPYLRKQIRFDADFDQKIIEGNAYIKGHFQLCVLAFYVIRAYLNKHVRKMIKLFTREGKKHG